LQNRHLLPPSFFFLSSMEEREGRGCALRGREGRGAGRRGGGPCRPQERMAPGAARRARRLAAGERACGRAPLPWRERGEGERGPAGKTITKNFMGNNEGQAHRRRRPRRSREKTSIGDEPSIGSMNRRHRDEALNEMNAAVPSDFVDDARIKVIAHRSWNHLRTSTSDFGSFESRLGVGFRNSERVKREDSSHIYIVRV
jgi:hypothetical protein